jgi:ATP-dependent DNA helicase Rep
MNAKFRLLPIITPRAGYIEALMSLNPAQKEAVEHFTGPMLILAGAGSGKTRVITQRIVRLLERGISPSSIVSLTFTNKAAREMQERVGHLLKGKESAARDLTVCTFHAFGLMVLNRERKSLGGAFTIFDQGDQIALVKELMGRIASGRVYDASVIMSRISNAKNAFITPENYVEQEGDEYDEITKLLYPRYTAALRNFKAYDFDDLVCEVARLLKEREDIRTRWRSRYRFLLVDEYQDTNGAQLELLRALIGDDCNLCVVGDDDQAIYGWRGADVRNILSFEDHFPGAKIVKLEQNYRSKRPILDVANAVIQKRTDVRHRKVLFTERDGGALPRVVTTPSPEGEAQWIAREIRELVKEKGVPGREVAVLYRSNGQSKAIEEALREQGVMHRVVGGQQFYERKEVKDLLGYLKLTLNRSDEISLRRIINYPPRGIGETSVERLAAHAAARGWSLWQAVERVDALDDVPSAAREGCHELERIMAEMRRKLLIERKAASDAARELCVTIGLKEEVGKQGGPQVGARRWGNVESILNTFRRRETKMVTSGKDSTRETELAAFLHALTLNMDEAEADPGNLVTLSTLHGSKGLEFDHVFFIGCEEGLMPHSRTTEVRATDSLETQGADNIEEERRLFYVGVTRAKERLTVSLCKHRVLRGKPTPRTPSRFLMDIPENATQAIEVGETVASMVEMSEGAEGLLAALLGDA